MKCSFFGIVSLTLACLFTLVGTACYYDNEEELYGTACDTAAVRYSVQVQNILNANCYLSCHAGPSPSSTFVLNTYQDLLPYINDGSFLQSIEHTGNSSPMPPGSKLTDCQISQIKAWVASGAPEN